MSPFCATFCLHGTRLQFGNELQIRAKAYLEAVAAIRECLDVGSEELSVIIVNKRGDQIKPEDLTADQLGEILDWLNSIVPTEDAPE